MAQLAISTVHEDNDRVRVTEWLFAPGTETGNHVHELDYTVVPLLTGTLTIVSADGEAENSISYGVPYFRRAGAEHNVINRSRIAVSFMEIEIK
jgi:quercetin dioxygenase-like cupin family protein|tara:strand:+ start:771 stop:1052 length:282 start_codon:yes stop_codon:yes gene_type:complete